ncbi:hypothetical protein LOK49_LG04G03801 [Camellia lanceoleosa]|uniref:Uncharacterized protein n=1 Tax=Camellia lanceoleosa TaxID=1840588 RepID=A0ACC0I531_9ERIC|nr:hypothetical protein LOK49_LG04G03801 [Camellia lanceoleosa]
MLPSLVRATGSLLQSDMNLNRLPIGMPPSLEWKKWTWRSKGDLFQRGAFFIESGDSNGVNKFGRLDSIVPKKGKIVKSLNRFSGVIGGCRPGVSC